MNDLEVFFFLGNISLFTNMIEDLKTYEINEIKNYSMTTAVLTLYLTFGHPLLTFLINAIFFYLILFLLLKNNFNTIGEGDITPLPWLINGLLMHGLITTIAYLVAVAILTPTLKLAFKIKALPLYLVYWFVFFVITWILFF